MERSTVLFRFNATPECIVGLKLPRRLEVLSGDVNIHHGYAYSWGLGLHRILDQNFYAAPMRQANAIT